MGECNNRYVLGVCVAGLLSMVAFLGCEKTNRGMSLEVTPNATTLSQGGDRVTLTASLPQANAAVASNRTVELLYPLEWVVTDPDSGRIVAAVGDSAVYQCILGGGRNTVIVRDQGDREGLASIN